MGPRLLAPARCDKKYPGSNLGPLPVCVARAASGRGAQVAIPGVNEICEAVAATSILLPARPFDVDAEKPQVGCEPPLCQPSAAIGPRRLRHLPQQYYEGARTPGGCLGGNLRRLRHSSPKSS
jgi:hypothetical protein